MSVNLESALRKANDSEDEKLYAALQLAETDQRWITLLQPLSNSVRNGADVSFEEAIQRHAMCPDLYRATLSGSANRVNELLGLTEETACIYEIRQHVTDVKVLLQDNHGSKRSNKPWGGKIHGDVHCMLQEVTAEKNTVLHIAAEQGHEELVEQIIRKDSALLLSENSRHETPLHLAVRAGNCRIISLILLLAQDSGIGAYEILTKRSINGDTVLHDATRHGHESIVKILMTVAPVLSAEVNNVSMSPLYLAVVRKSIGIVKELLQYAYASAVGPNQQNALHAAVLGCPEIVHMLLDWKADLVNEKDTYGSTPMHYAASTGDVTAVNIILDKAPLSVYIQDQEGSSPLHVAAQMRNYSVISCMLEHCPDSFEIRDNDGKNFLHIVTQQGSAENNLNRRDLKKLSSIIKLVSRSPEMKKLVNETDNEGNTPLHFASKNGFSEVIWHLLNKTEADTTLMNNAGKTALDHAVSLSNFFIMASTTATLSAYGAIFSPQRLDKIKNSTNKTRKWIDGISKNLIVVSVLIATIAFSAAFNVPGSYNDDGVANLRKKKRYQIFLVLDTIAMSTSVSAAVLLVVGKAKMGSWISFSLSLIFLWISLFTMELAFVIAVTVTTGKSRVATISIINTISISLFWRTVVVIYTIGSPAKLRTMRRFLSSMKVKTPTTRQIDIQFPKVASYVRRSSLFIFLNIFFYIITIVIVNLPFV